MANHRIGHAAGKDRLAEHHFQITTHTIMKPSHIVLSISLLLTSLFAAGQANDQAKPAQRSRITKGYYSISNSTPVAGAGTLLPADTGITTGVSKGYYSNQPDFLKTSSSWLPKRGKPVIRKGYYSIGDHINRFPQPDRK